MKYPDDFINQIICGDCLEKLKELPDNSVDSIVTDPPAGISFMGKSWDTDKGGRDNWIKWMCDVATECKRVLKPGGHAFVWAIPRTSHWTATAWENAGFEIRDVVAHIFGSGFPKSLNIGKKVDELQGNEREVVGTKRCGIAESPFGSCAEELKHIPETKGTSEWEGWGTALKPAREDWILMRKPLEKGLTVAENVLKYGTGGINIDKSRVDYNGEIPNVGGRANHTRGDGYGFKELKENINPNTQGRFPANLIHDNSEEVRECFPETKSVKSQTTNERYLSGNDNTKKSGDRKLMYGKISPENTHNDSGNASRFFKSILYYPKASKSERNKGCEGLEEKQYSYDGRDKEIENPYQRNKSVATNNHPTVKPITLMTYLIKMITPNGGIVLDPFAGSGSTLVAAKQNGYKYIGIELTPEYIPIIEARLSVVEQGILL